MPGICGVVDFTGTVPADRLLPEMLGRMRHEPWYVEQTHLDPARNVALGRTSLGLLPEAAQPVERRAGGQVGLVDGELYACEGRDGAGIETIFDCLERYPAEGAAALRGLNGSFAAVLWDRPAGVLTLVNDRFAMRPLYYVERNGRLLFASNLHAILADAGIEPAVSEIGLAEFLTYGQYLGTDTSVEGIRVLPAGCVARFEASRGKLAVERYWSHGDYPGRPELGEEDWLEAIDEAFAGSMARRVRAGERLGIALSGGLDARSILALVDQERTPAASVCYSVRGSLDDRCSAEMTRIAGGRYIHHELGTTFLGEYERHLRRMVRLTDGQYLSQCIVLPVLPLFRERGIDVLLRGHAGELMHMRKAYAYSLDRGGLAARSPEAVSEWLLGHLQSYMLDAVDGPLLTPRYQEALESVPRQKLLECIAETAPASPPVQAVWELFVNQRLRRETALSMAKIGSAVEVRLPFLDNDLVGLLLKAPPELKMTDRIQGHLLAKRRPAFLRVVNANTGARIGANRLYERFTTIRMRGLGRLGVPGYQPYERLGLWLRRELGPMVRSILLGERCAARGIFDPDAVRTVVEAHLGGRRNATYLIMAMMVIELGQQRVAGEWGEAEEALARAA